MVERSESGMLSIELIVQSLESITGMNIPLVDEVDDRKVVTASEVHYALADVVLLEVPEYVWAVTVVRRELATTARTRAQRKGMSASVFAEGRFAGAADEFRIAYQGGTMHLANIVDLPAIPLCTTEQSVATFVLSLATALTKNLGHIPASIPSPMTVLTGSLLARLALQGEETVM